MRFKDIVLDDDDSKFLNKKMEEYIRGYNAENGNGPDWSERRTKRHMLIQEIREGIWSNRDWTPADAGEAPKGAEW